MCVYIYGHVHIVSNGQLCIITIFIITTTLILTITTINTTENPLGILVACFVHSFIMSFVWLRLLELFIDWDSVPKLLLGLAALFTVLC